MHVSPINRGQEEFRVNEMDTCYDAQDAYSRLFIGPGGLVISRDVACGLPDGGSNK